MERITGEGTRYWTHPEAPDIVIVARGTGFVLAGFDLKTRMWYVDREDGKRLTFHEEDLDTAIGAAASEGKLIPGSDGEPRNDLEGILDDISRWLESFPF